jgi:hypothetical protein
VLHSYELSLEGRPNGRQLGYLPKREGAKLLWDPYMRERFPADAREQVEQMVQAAREAM